jgi:hypothetical protein
MTNENTKKFRLFKQKIKLKDIKDLSSYDYHQKRLATSPRSQNPHRKLNRRLTYKIYITQEEKLELQIKSSRVSKARL